MSYEEFCSIFAATAAYLQEPLQATAKIAITDGYESLKEKLLTRFRGQDVEHAVKSLEQKPISSARRLLLQEELEECGTNLSSDLVQCAENLGSNLDITAGRDWRMNVSIKQSGTGNSVKFAGRDFIETKKVTRKNVVKPDDRHIDEKQAKVLKELVEKHAPKFAGEDGQPNYKAVYGELYREFDVNSYKLIRKEDFDQAVSFLQQLGARTRSRLKKSAPRTYRNEVYGSIFAKWRELGRNKSEIYEFAQDRLAIKRRITSLTKLGPNQLNRLNKELDKEVARKRKK